MVPIRYNVRSVIERRATSLMTILGVALVSMIFVIVFGFSAGLKQSLLNSGEDRNVIVSGQRGLSSGALKHIHFQTQEVLCRHLFKTVDGMVAAYRAEAPAMVPAA